MAYDKFTTLTSPAVPLPIENIDTDQIIPARFLKAVERKGFGDNLFREDHARDCEHCQKHQRRIETGYTRPRSG